MSEQRSLLKRAWLDYIRHHIGKLLIALFFMLLEGAAMFVFVKSLQPLFDDIFVSGNENKILPVAIAVCGVFVVRGIGSFIHRSLTMKVGVDIVGDMQSDLTRHLLTLDIGFFNTNAPGALIERVRGDTQALRAFASGTLLTFGRDVSTLIAMLIAALQVDWQWTLMIFIGAPFLAFPMLWIHKSIRRQARKARESSAVLSTRLDEIFHGIAAIKLNSLAQHETDRFTKGVRHFVSDNMKSEIGRAAMPSVVDIIAGFGFVAVIYFGGQDIVSGEKTVGAFFTFFAAIALVLDPIRRLTNISGGIQMALANLERIYYLFDQRPAARESALSQTLNSPNGDIRFDHVNFQYGDTCVLNDLSFVAKGGKTTAFVGASGAGKSTLFKVLTQLELVNTGTIHIGQDDITTLDLEALRSNIAVVSQESALFDETLRDNIQLGDISGNPEQIEHVAKTALVSEFADELPDGLDSLAGPRGTNLSGGQRQRVVIARALLRDAPILLLDEATSALDNRTEQKIQSLLDDFSSNKTTLVIAHRLTTVMNADIIHVMKEGRVVESGTHSELIAKGGEYAKLHATLEV